MPSDSFERGGQPRSVSDPDKHAYDEMIRRHRALMANRESKPPRPAAVPSRRSEVDSEAARIAHLLNGAREARHEFERGQKARAIVDGITAGLDIGSAALFLKDGLKLKGPHDWRSTRKWMGDQGIVQKNQHAHHGLIPQKGWGKAVPDAIKNQPPNITPMPSAVTHTRMRGASRKMGLPRFTPLERYWHGTPKWWKAANGAALGHAAQLSGDHLPGHTGRTDKHNK